MHGSTTLVGDASFGGCHISPTSIDAWVIKLSDEDDAVVYDEISKKIIVMFEKSGGRTHQLSLFKVDCTTEVPDNDLLKLVSANGQLAGVNIDDLENEFLHMEIDVDLTKMESTSLRDTTAATGKVDFCVRADLKDGPGANSHGVNFIRARMTMEVNIVASIQEVAVKLESTDTDISMGPDDALTHVIELDACQCGIDALEPNDRCVESEAAHRDVSIDSPPKLTPSDRLILCISTQTDVVEIHEINNLKLTQPSDSGGDSTTFDVIEDSIVSGLASYDSLDKQTGHIHRVRTNLVNTFFKNTGSGTIDQTDVTVSGTAKVLFKPSRRLALANVVIKRSLQEQQEREGRFSMTIALQGNEDVEAPASTVALTGTTEALATAVAPTTTAEASIALTSSTTTTTLLWGYEVKSNMKCKNKGGEIELIIPDGTENLEHFCASKCNITGSCVGFVSKDKEAICGLRLRSMFAPTQNHGTSCYVRTGQASVQVTMRVENIEHSFLMANEGLLSQFVERVQRVVAQNAGNGVSHEDVEVLLSPGSIVIEASVHAYSGLEPAALHQELTTSVNILDDLAQSLQSIPGIASVSTGAIAVSNFQAAHRSATTPSDQTPMPKYSDEFDWVFFILIPGATLMFVLCLLCCAIWALRVRKQHRKEDDRQTVSGNDEESQKQEPSKAMTPSPASATAQTPIAASTALAETDAVIFVVDSNDQAQLKDVVSI
jgi:cbb3-type cytochrome oxidase subunit 3